MTEADADSTRRFSGRVEHYVKYRPSYPAQILTILEREIGLTPMWTIADVGSGTGISAAFFLRNGNTVIGIEPNAPMRTAAERALAEYPRFQNVNGTAEATTLDSSSVDAIIAAQAFHWFDVDQARVEFERILRPGGWVVLLWNTRRLGGTPFLEAYEALLQTYGTDYREVAHKHVEPGRFHALFGPGGWKKFQVQNEQHFDLEGLKGRLMSSSYVPTEGQFGHDAMILEIDRIFEEHQQGGKVCMEYDTEIYCGRMLPVNKKSPKTQD